MTLETNLVGDYPEIAPTACVHRTATLIGKVLVEDHVFIGPNAVLRADEPGPHGKVEPIVIGARSNIQDNVVIHALGGTGVRIGARVSIAHAAVVHGPCEIGEESFVGFHSTVFRAVIGARVVILHQGLVEGVTIPDGRTVPSRAHIASEQDVLRLAPLTPELDQFARRVVETNLVLARNPGLTVTPKVLTQLLT
jgi:carbonic anhydrase/acetyltransferase-like protein (isoleucine patch superfamily)